MLYSLRGNYPTELPNRIRLSDGSTRTDPENFTAEMIADAGYYEVEDPPIGLPITQTYGWDAINSNWSIIDQPQDVLDKMKQDYLNEVNNEKTLLLSIFYKIKLDEIEREVNDEPLVYNRIELEAYIAALESVEETYDEETMQVTWPLRPIEIGNNEVDE